MQKESQGLCMVNVKNIKQVFARHKRATSLWVITLITVGLTLSGLWHPPFMFAYGGSMWPTHSHLAFLIVDRGFPVNKLHVGDIVVFKFCPQSKSIEDCENLHWLDYFLRPEFAHRVWESKCKVIGENKIISQYTADVNGCYITTEKGEFIGGCGAIFEKIDELKTDCVFYQRGDCNKCFSWTVPEKYYKGKVIWYFNFPV